jgi:uncharacterized protein (TIGR03435 family)
VSSELILVNEVQSYRDLKKGSGTMKFPFPSGGRFTATNLTLKTLISFAFKLQNFEILGRPGWINSDRYDVEAKAAESNLEADQYRLMLRTLLEDRFKLAVHREMKETPVYAVLLAKGGHGLRRRTRGVASRLALTHGRLNLASPHLSVAGFFTGPIWFDGRAMSMGDVPYPQTPATRIHQGLPPSRLCRSSLGSNRNRKRAGRKFSSSTTLRALQQRISQYFTNELAAAVVNEVIQGKLTGRRIEETLARNLGQMSYSHLAIGAVFLLPGLAQAQSSAARPEFEVASVKPNTSGNNMIMIRPPVGGRFTATNARLKMLIGIAYNVQNFQISGGPGWIDSEGYDIAAKAAESINGIDQLRPLLLTLLEDRFKLMIHRETKEVPVYALMAAKSGLKLPAAKEGGCVAFGPNSPPPPPGRGAPGQLPPTPCGGFMMGPNRMIGGKVSMTQLVNSLSNILGRPVIDKTGFTGTFDVNIEFSPEGTAFMGGGLGPPGGLPPGIDTSGPSIFTVLQDQLGLRLESQKGPGEVLVIDHAEKASEN